MEAYAYKMTVGKKGELTLKDLPLDVGEKVEIIIIPRSKASQDKKRYPFWGKPIAYVHPTDPVADTDWEVSN